MDYLVAWGVPLAIMLLWVLTRYAQGSWIGPGGILCCLWFIGTLVPLIVTPDFPIYPQAYLTVFLFVLVGAVASSIPVMAVGPTAIGRRSTTGPALTDRQCRALKRVYWACLVIGIAGPVLLFRDAVATFGSTEMMLLAGAVTDARYKGEYGQSLLVTYLFIFSYLAAILGGLLYGLRERGDRGTWQYFLWAVPLLGVVLIMTTRAALLYGIVMFVPGMIAGLALRGVEHKVRLGRLMIGITGLGVIAGAVIFFGQMFRWGTFTAEDAERALEPARSSAAGHMAVLGDWMVNGNPYRTVGTGGTHTFAGLVQTAGVKDREIGLYIDSVALPNGAESNIFTAFRPMIDDFTYPGALVFFGLLSFGGGTAWLLLRSGRLIGSSMLVAHIGFVMWSPLTSLFIYNSIVAAIVCFEVVVVFLVLMEAGKRQPSAVSYARA